MYFCIPRFCNAMCIQISDIAQIPPFHNFMLVNFMTITFKNLAVVLQTTEIILIFDPMLSFRKTERTAKGTLLVSSFMRNLPIVHNYNAPRSVSRVCSDLWNDGLFL